MNTVRRCRLLPVVLITACSGPQEPSRPPIEPPQPPPNVAPVTQGAIPAQTVATGEAVTVSVTGYFIDPNGDALTYTATSSTDAVATAAVSGGALTVTGVSMGTAVVTVTATDPGGLTAIQAVDVVVFEPDRAALVALYEATNGENWTRSDNWLTEAPLGEWYGVGVVRDKPGVVRQLRLSANNLTGTLPAELGSLASLETLLLGVGRRGADPPSERNRLTGPVPSEVGQLKQLGILDLAYNDLTGEIPPELGDLASLRLLWLDDNELTGRIPPDLGKLSDLANLSLWGNELFGPIPAALVEGLESLTSFDWEGNPGLCAPRTDAFQEWLTNLQSWVGPLCDREETRAALEALYAATDGANWTKADNWLTETLVRDWYGISVSDAGEVRGVELDDNNLTGSIPPELGDLAELEWLNLHRNHLTGPIPPELSRTSLQFLILSDNRLTGPIPAALMTLDRLRLFSWVSNDTMCAPRTEEFANWLSGFFAAETYTWWRVCGEEDPGFHIELIFPDDFPAELRTAAEAAADFWMGALGETELPDRAGHGLCGEDLSPAIVGQPLRVIDDLAINFEIRSLDGPAGTAWACSVGQFRDPLHTRTRFPFDGRIQIDTVWRLWPTGYLEPLIRHEIAHVLGIGTIWNLRGAQVGLIDPSKESSPRETHFPGPLAVAAFDAAGGRSYQGPKVPVQQLRGGLGNATAHLADNAHWRDAVFGQGRELMTTHGSEESAISAITLQALADLGYAVDVTYADLYTLPAAGGNAADAGALIDLRGDVLRSRPRWLPSPPKPIYQH